jgi:hypothetical protein
VVPETPPLLLAALTPWELIMNNTNAARRKVEIFFDICIKTPFDMLVATRQNGPLITKYSMIKIIAINIVYGDILDE